MQCPAVHSDQESVMLYSLLARSVLAATMITVPTAYAGHEEFRARFSGFNEIGALNNGTSPTGLTARIT
jgi:hypothetical protein